MLKDRLGFGAFIILMLVGLIVLDDYLSSSTGGRSVLGRPLIPLDGLLLTTFVAVLAVLACDELYRLHRLAGSEPLLRWPRLAVAGFVFLPFAVRHGLLASAGTTVAADYASAWAWWIITTFGAAVFVVARRRVDGAMRDLAATWFIVAYVGVLASFAVRIRVWGPPHSAWLVLYFLAVVKCCDIGAYFTGLAVGRHKLIPWLSPAKTIEGLLGGMAASMLAAWGIARLVDGSAGRESELAAIFPQGPNALIFGLVMALAGQAGDLLESLFKRNAGCKDSAALVPAFGGILDVIDSPLVAAPLAYWMLIE
jgi:phosphatidate cytidylyltransferase